FLRSLDWHGPRTRAPRPRGGPAHRRPVGGTLFLERLETRVVPSFLAARAFDAGSYPRSVAVGGVNGDGLPDLAVANYWSNDVSVLLGTGDGTFQPARNFPAGRELVFVTVGDFNGDGLPDLVTANGTRYQVNVLLNNGDGSFQA